MRRVINLIYVMIKKNKILVTGNKPFYYFMLSTRLFLGEVNIGDYFVPGEDARAIRILVRSKEELSELVNIFEESGFRVLDQLIPPGSKTKKSFIDPTSPGALTWSAGFENNPELVIRLTREQFDQFIDTIKSMKKYGYKTIWTSRDFSYFVIK